MIFKSFNALFMMAFLASAAVQVNDPDPLGWIGIYLVAAVMCGLEFVGRLPHWIPWVLMVVCGASSLWLASGVFGQVSLNEIFASLAMQTTAIEEAREAGGLLLIVFWSGVLAWHQIRFGR